MTVASLVRVLVAIGAATATGILTLREWP